MTDSHGIGLGAKCSVERIGADYTNRSKGGCNASATVVGGSEKHVLFDKVVFSHANIIGEFGGYENAFTFSQSTCCFVQDAISPDNAVKECEGLTVLYDLIVFAHDAQNSSGVAE